MTAFSLGAWGDSLTEPIGGWADLTRQWLVSNYGGTSIGWVTQARSGNWAWSNLVRYSAGIGAADVDLVLCDIRPPDSAREFKSAEALIRKIWTDRPTARILNVVFPGKNAPEDTTVAPETALNIAQNGLPAYYGIPSIRYDNEVRAFVESGGDLTLCIADDETIHPTLDYGHPWIRNLVTAYLAANPSFTFNDADHSTLPTAIYDTDGYYTDATPQRANGNTGVETGTGWANVGTAGRESSTAGDMITFTKTCRSFGLYSAGTANTTCDVQIDGGAWQTDVAVTHNGQYFDDLSDAEHTITIRVRAGVPVRIDEFWAI